MEEALDHLDEDDKHLFTARIDTVYRTKTDTFYRERIIYREAKIIRAPKQKVFKVAEAVLDEKLTPEVGIT